jgi:hypothetical protein
MASQFASAATVDILRGQFLAGMQTLRDQRKIGVLDMIRVKRTWRRWNDPLPDGDGMTVGEAMADEIAMQSVLLGLAATPEAIDWSNVDWEKLFKMIIEFIKALLLIFGGL